MSKTETYGHKPYRSYKTSAASWLPKIPEHWETQRAESRLEPVKRFVGPYEVAGRQVMHYSIPNVQQFGGGILEPGSSIDSAKNLVDRTLLLVSKLNPRKGTITLASPDREFVTLASSEFVAMEPKHCVGRFAQYVYESEPVRLELSSRVESATKSHQRCSPGDVFKLQIAWPPPEEQVAIVRFLDDANEQIQRYIAGKERLIALLQEERQAMIHQAVTRGLDPNVRLKPSGMEWLEEVPEHWEVARFAREVNIAEGQVDPKVEPYASMLMVAPNHVESGTGQLLSRETAYEQGAISGKYFCRGGDVVYSKIRPALAKVLVAPTDCLCSADMYPLRPRNSLHSDYLFWLLLSTGFTAWSVLQSDRVAMPKINRQTLNNVHIPLPPFSEQVSIVRHLIEATGKASGAIDRAHRQIDLMNEYRSRLIADVVTGQLDVRKATAQLQEAP